MKVKIFLTAILLLILAGGAGYGLYQWNLLQNQKRLNEELTIVMGQFQSGNHPRAQENLERILKEYPQLPNQDVDDILARLAESYELTGDGDKAAATWQRILEEFPDSPHVDQALSWLAENAYRNENLEQAEQLWQRVLTQHKGSDSIDDAQYGMARLTLRREGQRAARKAFYAILDEHPDTNRRAEIEGHLGEINLDLLFSGDLDTEAGDRIYVIERGDTLTSISRKEEVSADLIMRVNGITDPRRLSIGRRLKIPNLDLSIIVDKTENTMTLLNDGRFFKRYAVRTGKDNWRTPNGEFKVMTKKKNPSWTNDGQVFAPGDPDNQLGTRWMGIEPRNQIGIHGTNNPATIGSYASQGCVGMVNEDVEELFDLVRIGTPVKITGKMETSG